MPAAEQSNHYLSDQLLKQRPTIASRLDQREEARIVWKLGFRGSDSYLVHLFKEGKLNGEYELRPLGCNYNIKGKFEMSNESLYFERGDVANNFTRESVIALAESLGYVMPSQNLY
jgi:hypothetical protein